MKTDWDLIRDVMTAAIDACEAAERLDLSEADRSLQTGTNGVVVWDVLTSAWTYPENTQYAIIRARHDLNDDVPYRLEFARVMRNVSDACAELVGASHLDEPISGIERVSGSRSIRDMVHGMANWYRQHMVGQLSAAAASKNPPSPDAAEGPGHQ